MNITKTAIDIHHITYRVPHHININLPNIVTLCYVCVVIASLAIIYFESDKYIDLYNSKIHSGIVIIILGGVLLYRPTAFLFARRSRIILDYEGIRIKDKVFLKWKDIEELYIQNLFGNFILSERLIIKTGNRKYKIWLTDVNKTKKEMNFWIEFFNYKNWMKH